MSVSATAHAFSGNHSRTLRSDIQASVFAPSSAHKRPVNCSHALVVPALACVGVVAAAVGDLAAQPASNAAARKHAAARGEIRDLDENIGAERACRFRGMQVE
jgi:hypothetical protein